MGEGQRRGAAPARAAVQHAPALLAVGRQRVVREVPTREPQAPHPDGCPLAGGVPRERALQQPAGVRQGLELPGRRQDEPSQALRRLVTHDGRGGERERGYRLILFSGLLFSFSVFGLPFGLRRKRALTLMNGLGNTFFFLFDGPRVTYLSPTWCSMVAIGDIASPFSVIYFFHFKYQRITSPNLSLHDYLDERKKNNKKNIKKDYKTVTKT